MTRAGAIQEIARGARARRGTAGAHQAGGPGNVTVAIPVSRIGEQSRGQEVGHGG